MRVACVGYRAWALRIYEHLLINTEHEVLVIGSKEKYDKKIIMDYNPDVVLFYGWSWKIEPEIFKNYKSIMLHPSPLPEFRGGSPIQNQIIRGVVNSKVTLFVIGEEYDAGDVVAQGPLSLSGTITEIFDRLTKIGTSLTVKILREGMQPEKQDDSKATYFSRRKPEQSEISLDEIKNQTGEHLYNKIRMLGDPYPNAFIRTSDGKKLLIKLAELGE